MKSAAILYLVGGLVGGTTLGWFAKDALAPASSAQTPQNSLKSETRMAGNASQYNSASDNGRDGSSSRSGFSTTGSAGNQNMSDDQINDLGQRLLATTDPLERDRIFNSLLESMTPENALTIRKFVSAQRSSDPEFRKFHYMYGKIAGKEAMLFGLKSPEGDGGAIIQGWANADPAAALAWLENVNVENTPELVALEERGYSADRMKSYLYGDLIKGTFSKDPTQAATYISDLEQTNSTLAGNISRNLVREIIGRQGIEAAVDWSGNFSGGQVNEKVIAEIADEWSEVNPDKALSWVQAQNEGDARSSAYYEVMRNMGGKVGGADPFAAAEVINQMDDSADKNYALSGYASGISRHYPQTAVEAAMQISDESMRQKSLSRAGSRFYRDKPNLAQSFFEQAGVAQDEINRMRRAAGLKAIGDTVAERENAGR